MVLVYVNSANGLSKAAFETVTYGKKLGDQVVVITLSKTLYFSHFLSETIFFLILLALIFLMMVLKPYCVYTKRQLRKKAI